MLRYRILLGVTPLILLSVAVGGYAAWLLVHLGGAVNTTLRENYRSIVAMRDLKEAALQIDRTLNLRQAGALDAGRARELVTGQAAVCRANVADELGNITEPGEREAAERLRAQDEAFLAAADRAVEEGRAGPVQQSLGELLAGARDVQRINERAMTQKDQRARDTTAGSTQVMFLAIAAALLLGLLFAYWLSRAILRPIKVLTLSAQELGRGNLDQVLPVTSRDELGQLADAFNKMAGKLRRYRQHTAEELSQARQATEDTFAVLPDPVMVFAADGTAVYQNPAAERLDKKLRAAGSPALPVAPLVEEVLRGRGDYLPESFEQALAVRVDERERFLLPRVIGLREGAGAGAVAILQDVTRFRLLDDVKTNLVATVSHELKTPLTGVRMAVHLLLEERVGSLNPKQTELLIALRDDAERLLDLINNLLDLARLESGAPVRHEGRPSRPEELVRRAVDAARELAGSGGHQLVVAVPPDLPPVRAFPEQLDHVFSNLLSNAARHSPPGEEIVVAARQVEPLGPGGAPAVRFSVTDRGSGVPAAERERVFEKFYRLPGTPREGAGLGLAICKEIIRAHDGRIGVVDAPGGHGSEFFFVLPGVGPAAPVSAASPARPGPAAPAALLASGRPPGSPHAP